MFGLDFTALEDLPVESTGAEAGQQRLVGRQHTLGRSGEIVSGKLKNARKPLLDQGPYLVAVLGEHSWVTRDPRILRR